MESALFKALSKPSDDLFLNLSLNISISRSSTASLLNLFTSEEGTNELSTFIEAVWVSSVKSPNIIFGTDLFLASIKNSYDIVATSRLSIEHELLKMIIEQYYPLFDY